MKTVRGLSEAKRVLCDGRGLDFDSLPPTTEAFGETLTPSQVAERIIAEVRDRGDDAVRDLSRRLDGIEPPSLEVSPATAAAAHKDVPEALIKALRLAERRVRRFHEATLPKSWTDSEEGYGELVNPVSTAGAYVPGGTARLISTVLMTVVPAKVAGVEEVIVCTPGRPDGSPDPAVLAACDIAGASRVFQIGGAQAIAAMAYGTESVPRVDIVCGPGNIYVTLAKKLLYGQVGIEGLYGPTETVVVADEYANPTLCAADLVAQAEHDALATPILITTSSEVAQAVEREAELRAGRLDRSEVASASLKDRGCIAIVDSLDEAFELANDFAPEHVSLAIREPWSHVERVRNAGIVFLGEHSHEVLGDYVAGPSHVMPTGGTARFSSGIGVRSFLKFSPVVGLDRKTSAALTEAASILGRAEGLTGHAEAAEIRDELFASG